MSRTTATSNSRAGSSVDIEVDSETVNLFFDGTKNNLYNTDTFKGLSQKKKKEHIEKETSYANAFSNVAHMFLYGNENNDQKWIYIQGIGTVTGDENDELLGYAFGDGDTGVVERAKEAFGKIEQALEQQPKLLIINVFGFSRGAATARHFIHLAKSKPSLFKSWRLSKHKIRFRFVGLFDTVSSYQFISLRSGLLTQLIPIAQAVDYDFDNDVDELKLDFRDLDHNDKKLTKVFHIKAADEYRANFSVTNIQSAINDGYGYEILLNGAHADIGGAYPDKTTGKQYDIEIDDTVLKNWLIDQSFFRPNEFIEASHSITGDYFRATRSQEVYNDIHKITLNMMARLSISYGKMSYLSKLSNYYEAIRPTIKQVMGHLPNKVVSNVNWGSSRELTLAENSTTKAFRRQYIHWSAKYVKGSATKDLGFGLRRYNKGKGTPYRKPING